jgi:PAS domain S-box-containing protein
MIHSSPDAITLRSLPDRRYIEISEGFTRLTGYAAEEVIGKTPSEVGIWSDDSPHTEILENILREGEVREVEFGFRTKSGEHRYATVFRGTTYTRHQRLHAFDQSGHHRTASPRKGNFCNPKEWKPSADWPAALRTTSITCSV